MNIYIEINDCHSGNASRNKIRNKTETVLKISTLISDDIIPFSAMDNFNIVNTLIAFAIAAFYFLAPIHFSEFDDTNKIIQGQILELNNFENKHDKNGAVKISNDLANSLLELRGDNIHIRNDYFAIKILFIVFFCDFIILIFRKKRFKYLKLDAYNTSVGIVDYIAEQSRVKTHDKEAFLNVLEKKLIISYSENPYWVRFGEPKLSPICKDLIYGITRDWEESLGKAS